MNLLEQVERRARGYRYDEDVPFDADWPADREQLWILLGEAEAIKRAASDLVATLKTRLAETIQENESIRLGDTIYRMSPDRRERITDPEALREFLGKDWHHVIPVTSSTRLKKGGLKAVCERRDLDYQTFRDTFIDTEWGEPRLTAIPISRAPKYTQKLEHGGSTFGRGQ